MPFSRLIWIAEDQLLVGVQVVARERPILLYRGPDQPRMETRPCAITVAWTRRWPGPDEPDAGTVQAVDSQVVELEYAIRLDASATGATPRTPRCQTRRTVPTGRGAELWGPGRHLEVLLPQPGLVVLPLGVEVGYVVRDRWLAIMDLVAAMPLRSPDKARLLAEAWRAEQCTCSAFLSVPGRQDHPVGIGFVDAPRQDGSRSSFSWAWGQEGCVSYESALMAACLLVATRDESRHHPLRAKSGRGH
jgi:hypothetical protein